MDGRNAKGQFVKGHQVSKGKGRPSRSVEEKYLRAFSSIVTVKEFKEIVLVALSRAKAGDLGMVRLVFEYQLGKPRQRVEVEGEVGFKLPEVVEVRIRETGDRPPSRPEPDMDE